MKVKKEKQARRRSANACTAAMAAADGTMDPFEALADAHAAGNGMALFEAIRFVLVAADRGRSLPGDQRLRSWIYIELQAALKRYGAGEARDLGEAFSISRPKGWRQAAHKTTQRLQTNKNIMDLMRNLPKTEAGFEAAGKKLGLSRAGAERLYYKLKKLNPQKKQKQ